MSDILLSVGMQKGRVGSSQLEIDLKDVVERISKNPPKVAVGLKIDQSALNHFKYQLSQIVNSISLGNGSPITVNISGLAEVSSQAANAASALNNMASAAKVAQNAANKSGNAAAKTASEAQKAAEEMARAETERQRLLRNATSLLTKMQDAERNWTKAAKGNTKEQYASIKSYISQIQTLRSQFEQGKIDAATFKSRLDTLSTSFLKARSQIRAAGEATKTLGGHFGSLVEKFGSWLTVSQVIMAAIRTIKKMVSTVIELDTAMTELKKVTNESNATYARFLANAPERAKALGAAMSEVVSATADFARLGYGVEDASELADIALLYKNIGDGIEDVTQASESIVSTMQAFGMMPNQAMHIVDVFNSIGNNFAISSGGIGEALQRSAAAMNAAGNTLEETAALVAAANTVVQNPESVGKNLPNNAVMRCKKTAISVKGQRWPRPRKDFVVCARRVRSSTSFCYAQEVITMTQKTGVYVQCEYCGTTVYKTRSQYKKRKQHFCSNKCQSMLKREIAFEHRPCEVCGNDMYLSKKSTKRFCSNQCQHTWQLGNTGFNNKRFQGGYVKCESCGKEFIVGKYVLDSNRKHFCSTLCRQTWYSTVWSQSETWRLESRERAARILGSNPVTTQTKPQVIANTLLEELNVSYRNEELFTYYSIDNYLPEYNLAIEVMGDYWHSSPLKYPKSISDRQRHIVSRDKAKHTYLKSTYGIEVLYLWESDLLKRPEVCSRLIRHYIEREGNIPNYHSFNYSVVDDRLKLNDVIVRPYQERRAETAC